MKIPTGEELDRQQGGYWLVPGVIICSRADRHWQPSDRFHVWVYTQKGTVKTNWVWLAELPDENREIDDNVVKGWKVVARLEGRL